MKKFSVFITAALAILCLSPAIHADDIDIYVGASVGSTDAPVVMFTLDYRSNLGSTACGSDACSFLTTKTYKDAAGVDRPYLTLSSGTTTYFSLLRGTLKYVLQQVGSSGVKIGFAMNHENNNNCAGPTQSGCSNGGYIIQGATPLTTQAQRDSFYAKLDALPVPGGTVAHPYQGKELFFELFRYFSGQGWYNMKNGWNDRGTNSTYNVNQALDYGTSPGDPTIPSSWDSSIISGANYISPVGGACTKVYTVNILFQVSQQEADSDTAIKASKAAGGMPGIVLQGTTNSFDTVIRWMRDNDVNYTIADDQKVISYFIVDPSKVNNTTRGYAGAGQGVSAAEPYTLSNDPEILINTLSTVFKNILSTSTSFVAPSVAVNVYNRAQVLNEVYIAMFQAEENGLPRWPGNLKKYAIGTNSAGDQEIQDANSVFAVANDGRIKHDALSYWTIGADLPAPPPSPATTDIVAGKDGRIVNRGGGGSKIPGFKLNCTTTSDQVCTGSYNPGLTNPAGNTTNVSKRKLFTEPDAYTNGTATALRALNADVSTATALQSALGASTVGACDATDSTAPPAACYLLKYARGLLNDGTTTQPWLLGDLLHSRPLAINYGARTGYSTSNSDVRILAAGNDGFMHMFRNTDSSSATAGSTSGVETWGFMPREVMPKLSILAANNAVTPVHPYLTDGAPVAYITDVNSNGVIETGDKVYLYFGLRRGGTSYYALDISNPDDPKMLWRITKTGDFAELGQTWSTPKVGKMLYGGSTTPRPVLIFGGGYDTNKDTHAGHSGYSSTVIGSNDSMGNAIFIVNAETGALIWKAVKGATTGYNSTAKAYRHTALLDSIPSDILHLDTDGNGLVDRVYVGDTGGVVWRIDSASNDEANWILTPILSVGRHASGLSGLVNDRRFFNAPDYAQTLDDLGAYDAIVIGTGDRENPKDTSIENWFYMFKDRDISSSAGTPLGQNPAYPVGHTSVGDVTSNCLQDGSCTTPPNLNLGWRMKLECPPSYASVCGEKNLATAFTLGGVIYFTSYIPAGATTGACSLKEGGGLLYAVNLQNGTAAFDFDVTTSGLTKSDRVTKLQSAGIPASVVSLGNGNILQPDLSIRNTGTPAGFKSFWYNKK